jgi:hypothetical protein
MGSSTKKGGEKMKRIFFITAILVLGAIAGCTKSDTKYVGKYISEQTVFDRSTMRQVQEVLEIRGDGTWKISPATPGESSDGEWKIDKDGIVLYAGKSRIPMIIGQIEGKKLVDRLHGESFIKQN